jgi:hypothetical protein
MINTTATLLYYDQHYSNAPLLREFGIERIETVLPTIVSLFSEKPNKQEVETIRVERKWMATRRIPKV